jgi:hypothetical protein
MSDEIKEIGDELVNESYCIKLKNKIKIRDKAKNQKTSKSKIVDKLIEDCQ